MIIIGACATWDLSAPIKPLDYEFTNIGIINLKIKK
jgi:hypothetical protein